jgi:hypothetical protein
MNGIASRMNISLQGLEQLANGIVPNEVASRLHTATQVIQDFVDGTVVPAMIQLTGGSVDQLEDLRRRIGREGAIGLIIGLLIGREK